MHSAARLSFCALLACSWTLNADTFAVHPTDSGSDLANSVIGAGVTIVGMPTLTAQPGQTGTFTNFNSGSYSRADGTTASFVIPSGIILTNGLALSATGNYNGGADNSVGGAGAPELTALSGFPTYDAAILKFNFRSTSPVVYFNFAFASTEYPEFVNSYYNDVFGLFVNGNNVAVVPGTTTPISVNSVNAGTNANYFTRYSDASTPFNYGGVTTIFTASADVSTSGLNTIEFAIADASDSVLDSAVLVQANSLSTVPPLVSDSPEPASMLLTGGGFLLVAGLVALRQMRERTA